MAPPWCGLRNHPLTSYPVWVRTARTSGQDCLSWNIRSVPSSPLWRMPRRRRGRLIGAGCWKPLRKLLLPCNGRCVGPHTTQHVGMSTPLSKTTESDTVVAEAIWTAPAELGTHLDSFRAEATEQVREVRSRSMVDNLLMSNETAASKATMGGSHGGQHGDSKPRARPHARLQSLLPH